MFLLNSSHHGCGGNKLCDFICTTVSLYIPLSTCFAPFFHIAKLFQPKPFLLGFCQRQLLAKLKTWRRSFEIKISCTPRNIPIPLPVAVTWKWCGAAFSDLPMMDPLVFLEVPEDQQNTSPCWLSPDSVSEHIVVISLMEDMTDWIFNSLLLFQSI